jgi:hypothetical protein
VVVSYRDPDTDEELVIQLPLIPNVGSFDGGETVFLRGSGIRSPVEVTFDVEGALFPAAIVEVIESVPLSAPGQIKVQTPAIVGIDRSEDRLADVIVKRGVGTASEQIVTLPSAFTFLAGMEPPVAPVLYGLDPAYGQRLGGDQVTVFGRNLDTATRAIFTFRGSPLEADILSATPDGLQMLISTPRFSAAAMEQSEFADFSAIARRHVERARAGLPGHRRRPDAGDRLAVADRRRRSAAAPGQHLRLRPGRSRSGSAT